MSRSYKKSPVYTYGKPKTIKAEKRIANRKVRRAPLDYDFGFPGSKYKKLYDTYFIHDFTTYKSKQHHLDSFELVKRKNSTYKDETFPEWAEKWERWYRRK